MGQNTQFQFKNAKAVWLDNPETEWNQFAGFYTKIDVLENTEVYIALAARSYYKLYINGEFVAAGPARTAEHYCRVDELSYVLSGECHIAVEVAAYSNANHYCNDCTLEPGLLIMEITDADGNVLSATGKDDVLCRELTYRKSMTETMSHCRGIVEYYELTPESFSWRMGDVSDKTRLLEEQVTFLKRRAPYADYKEIIFDTFLHASDIKHVDHPINNQNYILARIVNPAWYAALPTENLFLNELLCEEEVTFSGTLDFAKSNGKIICIQPGTSPAALTWELPAAEVGFIDVHISVESECTLDMINGCELNSDGEVDANTYAARFKLAPGRYHFTSFEPKLAKYVKLILRTDGMVKLKRPILLDDSYPDEAMPYFSCDDGELNRIYDAARRTLRLNTLDIFMDCPERERGGWLCDSYFSARGAASMFGDSSVEKDFIENFMLTDAKSRFNCFFPEVYPAVRGNGYDVGIRNWSFWLILELCDYCERTGDTEFIEQCRARVEAFIDGLLSLRGESGLLENIGTLFVDASQSNLPVALEPISVPVNCLAVFMLEQVAVLYDRADWASEAEKMRTIIDGLDTGGIFAKDGDAAVFTVKTDDKDAVLSRSGIRTESGIALELWSGFHSKDAALQKRFREEMGASPQKKSDPNIGKSNLFIGVMIRFDVLARMGRTDLLIREWKDLYLNQLRWGLGTLSENLQETGGCHGFNGYIGALMTSEILGLGIPSELSHTVRISPHPGNLNFASGRVLCSDGEIHLRWAADHDSHKLKMTLSLPQNWTAEYDYPFELESWEIIVNGEKLH